MYTHIQCEFFDVYSLFCSHSFCIILVDLFLYFCFFISSPSSVSLAFNVPLYFFSVSRFFSRFVFPFGFSFVSLHSHSGDMMGIFFSVHDSFMQCAVHKDTFWSFSKAFKLNGWRTAKGNEKGKEKNER